MIVLHYCMIVDWINNRDKMSETCARQEIHVPVMVFLASVV